MLTLEIRDRAFGAFLEGRSLASISNDDWAPSLRTLKRLSASEGWVEKRRRARAEALEEAVRKHIPQTLEQDRTTEGLLNKAVVTSLLLIQEVLERKRPSKDLPMPAAQLARFVRNALR